jgi:hypothetical protein
VGVHVYSDDKVGIDAGELAGLKPIGVKAGNCPSSEHLAQIAV